MDKAVENLSASFNLEFYYPWEPTIQIDQPVIVFYQKSTKSQHNRFVWDPSRFSTKAQEILFVV